MSIQHSELLKLKNLGMATVNILRAIGINTHEDLKAVGAVNAYRRVKDRKINVSKVMLYAIHGALQDVHWNELSAEVKAQLVHEAEADHSANV